MQKILGIFILMACISSAGAQDALNETADTALVNRINILEQKLIDQSIELKKLQMGNLEIKKQLDNIRTTGINPARKKKAVVDRRGSKQVTWQ